MGFFKKLFGGDNKNRKELERYIHELSMFLPLAVFYVDKKGLITEANRAAQDFSGYTENELNQKRALNLFKNNEEFEAFFERVFSEEEIRNKEMVFLTRSGRKVPVSVSASVRKNADGKSIGIFLAVSDISEIKEFREEMEREVKERTKELEDSRKALMNVLEDTREAKKRAEEEKKKTRAALVSLNDGVIVFDEDKRIALVNPPAEEILNIDEKAVASKRLSQLIENPKISKLYDALGGRLEWTGRKQEIKFEDPMERFFQISVSPVALREEVVGLMLIFHDITRQKEINRMKSEFVSIAAHQLRTPLSGIKWTLKMLLDEDAGELNREQKDLVEKSYENNNRMINLINDLLNVARMEEGRFAYDKELVSMEDLIRDQIKTLEDLAKERGVGIEFDVPEDGLPKVKADKEKIELVVHNLVENAVRYSPEGEVVTVSARVAKMELEVMVKDNGIGIPEKQQNRIFSKFFRADNAMKSDVEGNGLGLFICKNIINSHKGKIWFESEKGEGTAFWFTLPLED